jgi:flavin-dependent dehydrogenase
MVGDAFGFVDPMLSPGVFLALRSAELVAKCLGPVIRRRAPASPAELCAALDPYAEAQRAMLVAWKDLVAYLYDGRLAALMRSGRAFMAGGSRLVREAAQHHIERHIGLQASGAATTSRYSRGLLRLLSRHGLGGVDPATLAIH